MKNVTASDTVANGVYQLDLAQTDGDVDSADKALSSLVAVATAGIATGILVVVPNVIKAGQCGYGYIAGRCKIRVERTAAVNKMDRLKGVNAQNYAVTAAAGDMGFAIALEASGASAGAFVNLDALMIGSAITHA